MVAMRRSEVKELPASQQSGGRYSPLRREAWISCYCYGEGGVCPTIDATRGYVRQHNQRMESQTYSVRLDVWLWAARLFKTRQLAKQAVDGGKVALNGAAGKPAKQIREGDTLHVTRALERFEVSVLAVSEKRGPASVAQGLYRETATSIAARAAALEQRRLTGGPAPHPDGRPDKHARRQLQRINKGDALPPWFPK